MLDAGPIHYREGGSGPPVVFVHGAIANGRLWDGVASELSKGYRCIVPDWPMGSHSEAMNPDADLSPRGQAGLIGAFLAALDLDDVTIVANDSGGAVSQILVTERPDRVGRLALTNCDSFEHFPPGTFKTMVWMARAPGGYSILVNSMRLRAIRTSPIAYGALTSGPADDGLLRAFTEPQVRDAGIRRDGRKFVGAMRPADTLAAGAKLPSLEIPALIAWGVEDRFFKLDHARRIAAAIPDSKLVEIAGASTFVMLDRPHEVAAAIEAFLAD
jgi:pimeloyl-ACP methyl ester carboxylesterase